MAPKRLQPPVPSSEDEDQGSESQSKSESEELTSNKKAKNPSAPSGDDSGSGSEELEELTSNKKGKNPSAPSDDDSGSGSEELELESPSDPTVKPPIEDPAKSFAKQITRSKPTSLVKAKTKDKAKAKAKAKAGAGVKRPAENEPPKRAKKKKLLLSEEEENGAKKGEDQKKPLFQRLWSEDDEIVILKGFRDYVAKKGIHTLNDMKAFHDFIKESLHVDVSKNQLKDKVHRLKKKFLNNVRKEREGKDRIFSKPHEQKSYDVSKKIWATDGTLLGLDSSKVNNNGSARKNSTQPNARQPVEQSGARRNIQFGTSVGVGDTAVEHEILNDGLEYIARSKRVELEDKWKTLRVEECHLYLKKVELIQEQTTLVLEAIKAGGEEEEEEDDSN